jgi:hypothetical protein
MYSPASSLAARRFDVIARSMVSSFLRVLTVKRQMLPAGIWFSGFAQSSSLSATSSTFVFPSSFIVCFEFDRTPNHRVE